MGHVSDIPKEKQAKKIFRTLFDPNLPPPLPFFLTRYQHSNTNAATLIAIDEINANAALLPGITLVPTFADDAGEFVAGFLGALCLAERGVPVIIGSTYSDATLGLGIIARKNNIPLLATTASSPKLANRDADSGYPTFSRIYPDDEFQGIALIDLAVEFNWKNVATITKSLDTYAIGLTTSFSLAAQDKDITLATQVAVDPADSDEVLNIILNNIKNSGSRIIYAFIYLPELQRLIALADALGMIGDGWVWIG
jgi:ABC-type branched-subunit amino acid transport system substrate-binding protein